MLNLMQYKLIKQVKDSSPFTCDLSTNEYIEDVKTRLARWKGVSRESITLEEIYLFLSKGQS